jgi:peptidoglycan/xylan/chitin deacetylase (PgdA/CDA1 family)
MGLYSFDALRSRPQSPVPGTLQKRRAHDEVNRVKLVCLTLDLEPDHCDLVEGNHYDSFRGIAELLSFLRERGIPLTVFATGRVLDERREAVSLFAEDDAEIELHSYSHKRNITGPGEIDRAVEAYDRMFGALPRGYRAPLGLITKPEIEHLSRIGFAFDSSIFPSLFPGRFYNASTPTGPYFYPGTTLLEIPFSVIRRVRIPVALSYMQLLGHRNFGTLATLFGLPEHIVIDFHLHDIFPSAVYRELPLAWKLVYTRAFLRDRTRGMADFAALVDMLSSRGYGFARLADLHEIYGKGGIA